MSTHLVRLQPGNRVRYTGSDRFLERDRHASRAQLTGVLRQVLLVFDGGRRRTSGRTRGTDDTHRVRPMSACLSVFSVLVYWSLFGC